MKNMKRYLKPVIAFSVFAVLVFFLSAAFATKTAPEKKKIKVVCIDAGHGGKDPGCHGDFAKEKDVALSIALKLGNYIETNFPDIKVVYTRKTDVFVELNERAAIANRNNADLFICIHCNSACARKKMSNGKYKEVCNEEARGSETYIMGLHKTEGNLEVAKRENDAVLYEDDYQNKYNMGLNTDEAVIILSAYQNLYLEQSSRFAELCQIQFKSKAGREDKGVKQAGFLVLWKTSMPSVLIETGFLTNPEEERFLGNEKGQTYMASCIFRAFRKWKDEVEGKIADYSDAMEKMDAYKPDPNDTAGLRKPKNNIANGNENGSKPANTDSLKKTVKSDSAKIKAGKDNNNVTGPVVYRVQIVSSDKPLKAGAPELKGIQDTWEYKQGNAWKYTSGNYSTMNDAAVRQSELRKQGFAQAFVVAFDEKGNRITIDEAKKRNGGK